VIPESEPPVVVERSLGAAAVVGLVRGVVAGTVLAAIPCVGVFADAPRHELWPVAQVWLGTVLAASSLAIGDMVSARLAGFASQGARFLGGFLAPLAAFAPVFSLADLPAVGKVPIEGVIGVAFFGVALGLGQVASGAPRNKGYARSGCARGAIAGVVTGVIYGGAASFMSRGDGGAILVFMTVFALWVLMALLAFGNFVAGPLASRVARALEPDAPLEETVSAGERFDVSLRRAGDALYRAREEDGYHRPVSLERSLVEARRARDAAVAGELGSEAAGQATRAMVEALIELGRLDDAESLLGEFPRSAPIRAELLRLRGDPAGALALARSGLDALVGDPTSGAKSLAASYRAILALAENDLGNKDTARAHLAQVSEEFPDWYPRVLARLSAKAVAASLDRKVS
jgi:hypothetical protein